MAGRFARAVQYYLEAIKIVSSTVNSSRVSVRILFPVTIFCRYFMSSSNNVNEEMRALDSCIGYAMQLEMPSDINCVAALYRKVGYFFDIGDYHRCIDYAIMCEKFALGVRQSRDGKNECYVRNYSCRKQPALEG